MANTAHLQMKKEFQRTVDAGSNEFFVKIIGHKKTPFMEISGSARNIFDGNTFHLDDDFNDALEKFGIDPFSVVEALEAGESTVDLTWDTPSQKMGATRLLNELNAFLVEGLGLKSIEDGKNVGESESIVGIEQDDTIVFHRDLKRLCENNNLGSAWLLFESQFELHREIQNG